MTHIKVKNIFQFFFFIGTLTLLANGQSCNSAVQFPPQLTLYTGEIFRYYLLDYFSGASLNFATTSTLPSYSRIVPSYTSFTTSANVIPPFISYKIYKSSATFWQGMQNSMVVLYTKTQGGYYVQSFSLQTATTAIQNLTAPIQLNGTALPTDAVCYDLTYISAGQVIVDCYSPSANMNYFVPVSLTAQIMLSNTLSFPEYSTIGQVVNMKRNLATVTLNNQIYLLRYAYFQYLPAGNTNTYIATFGVQLSSTAAYGPTIIQFAPINGASFGLSAFQMQNLVLKGSNLFIYEASSKQILKTQLTFQGLGIQLPVLGSITVNTTINAMDAFFDGENYTLAYALQGYGIYEVDWTTNTPFNKYMYPWNPLIVNFNKLTIGSQYIMTFFNNNSTTNIVSIMEVYQRGSVAYPMLQLYNTSFFKSNNALEMDQISGMIYSIGNSYSATNLDQMIQLQLPFVEFSSTVVGALTNFTLQCTANFNNQTYAAQQTTFQVQSLQAGQVQIISQSGAAIAQQTLYANYPGQAYDDLSRYYRGPGLQYSLQANSTNPWTPTYKIASLDNYISQSNFQFTLSNQQTLNPSNVIFLKQVELFSGIYQWYVQDNNFNMYIFIQNYESNEQYIENYIFSYQWSAQAINLELLEPWVAVFAEGTTCLLYFYNDYTQTFFQQSLCDSTKYKINYFNLIGNQLYVSINDLNSSSTTRLNGQIITATISLQNFYSNSAFNLIQWQQFPALQALTNFYPQIVYAPWDAQQPIVYIQCEQSTIVLNTLYNIIYQTIVPVTTPYQIALTQYHLLLIESTLIEQYQIYNPQQIYKTINYPSYTFAHPPCYSTSQTGLQFTQNVTLIYDQCNNQIVIFAPHKNENRVFQNTISVPDFNFFTIARTYKIPNVISVLGKSTLNLFNYYQYQFLGLNSFINTQQAASTQTFYFQITVTSILNNQLTQTIPYTFVNNMNQYYQISQSATAEIDYAHFFDLTTATGKLQFTIPPHKWFNGMIANFSVGCTQTNSNTATSCSNLATIQNTLDKNRTIGGIPYYFTALAKGNKFNYAQSNNKLFRIYNYTNSYFDFVQLPFNELYGGACYALAVADSELFAVSACLNGTWRLYVTSFMSSEPTVGGSFSLNTSASVFEINKLIIKDNYVFVVFGGITLKDGFNYVQIIKLNFDNYQASNLFTPVANFTLKANKILYGIEHILTTFDIKKTQTPGVYRFFMTDYFGNLYVNLFTPASTNAYFSNFMKLNLYYYLDTDIQAVKPLLTGMKIFNYQVVSSSDTYSTVIVFQNYHSYEVTITFSSTAQTIQVIILNKYMQYGVYENMGNVDVMNSNNDGFVVMTALLPDRFVNDPNYAGYPIQLLLAYDRTNKSFTAFAQASASYPLTILTGSYSFITDEVYSPFIAQIFPSTNTSQDSSFNVLLINPDTSTLDNFFIQRYIQITLDSSLSASYSTLQLNAYNSLKPQAFQFNLIQEISGGGQLSQLTCNGLYAFPPATITQSETTRYNLLDYFQGPNIAYTITAPAANIASIPTFVNNATNSASQGIVPYYTSYKVYKPFSAWNKEWQQQMAFLYYDYQASAYKIQQYQVPTTSSPMTTVNQPIVLNFGPDIKCFDLEYINGNTLIIDCHSPTQYLNYFVVISNILSSTPTLSYQSTSPYQSLTSPPLNRHIFIYQSSSSLQYVFRCQYAQDYTTADQQLTSQTYVEQFTFYNLQLIQLFPITASLCSLNTLSISNLLVSQNGYLFIQNGLSIYKIGPQFLGITFTPNEFATYSSIYITNIYGMTLNFNGTSMMLYIVAQQSDNSFYIQEIDWTNTAALQLTSRININNYLAQVTSISASNDYIIMAYNNQNTASFGSYLDIYSIGYSQNIYQMPFSNMQNFTHDKFNNYFIILENTRTMAQNTQQMFTISMPYLYIQSAQTLAQTALTIGCTSSYYVISNTTTDEILPVNPTTTQASEPLILTINSLNIVQLTPIQAGVYNSLAQTQAPGQAIMDLTQFYTGPQMQFAFAGTGVSATWPTSTTIFNFNTIYSNSAFAFNDTINNKTISVSSIIFFKQFQFAPDIMLWIFETTNYTFYTFGEIVRDQTIKQLEFKPYTFSSPVTYFDFATRDVAVQVEANYNCTLYFFNTVKQLLFSKQMCQSSSTSAITHIKVLGNTLYVFVQNSSNYFVSQVYFNRHNFHNNTAFAWLNWNTQLTSTSFLNIQNLASFVPQKIYQSLSHQNRVVMKCASYILIFDPYSYHIFAQIPITTAYQIAVTANDYLTIIQPTQITEYNFYDSLNIYMTKASYPSYAGTSFSVADGDVKKTDYFVYIRQPAASQILVIQPGNPMMSAVQNIITLNADFQFFEVEKSFDNIFETIAVFGTNSLNVYNFYIQKHLEISAQSLSNAGNLTFNLTFSTPFSAAASHTLNFTLQQTPNLPMFSIAQGTTPIDFAGFINIETFVGSGSFSFIPHNWFTGVITSYSINCSQSCQNNVAIQQPLGLQRQITPQQYFVDVKKGTSYTYAQSANKVFRLYTYLNQIFDMVTLPFSLIQKQCYNLAVAPTEYYSVSGCYNGEIWEVYMVSYLSSEPHVFGNYKLSNVQNIQSMIIQNNYLFVIDAAENIKDGFNGIAIYYLNFTAAATSSSWVNYIDTFTVNKLSSLAVLTTINSIDIQPAELTNSYRFFFADSSNYMHTVLFQPNQVNSLLYYQSQQSVLITHYLDPDAQAQKNLEFVGIKAFNLQITTTPAQQAAYNLIIVFKNFHTYEIQMQFSTNIVQSILVNKFILNGFYQNQNNFDVINYSNDGFLVIQAILPERISNSSTYSSLAQQVLMVYDRTNLSFTQTISSTINSTIVMATYPFPTLSRRLRFVAQIYPGASSQNNYSILAISPLDQSFNNLYLQRNAQFVVSSIDFSDNFLNLILANDLTNTQFAFNITKETGQNGTLATSQCKQIANFPSITLGVSEFYQFTLSNYFQGESLQFTITPATQTMVSVTNQLQQYPNSVTFGVLNIFDYMTILKTVDSQLIAWDQYGATLTQFSNAPTFTVTRYLLPTENTQMTTQGQINYTLNNGAICYEIKMINAYTAIIDCIDSVAMVNNFVLVDFSQNTYTVLIQPLLQQLQQPPLYRHLRLMASQNGLMYIFRAMYKSEYSTPDQPLSSAGYIEVFSYYNGKISELYPLTAYTFGLTLLALQQLEVYYQSVFIYDALSNNIFKITPNFLSLQYPVYPTDTYTVPGTFLLFTVSSDDNSILVATTVNQINYLYQVTWLSKVAAVKYYLNSNINQIAEIYATPQFVAVEYNNGLPGTSFIGYIDIYETYVPNVLFQRQVSSSEFYLFNPFKNQLLILLATETLASNYVSLWQISSQSLILDGTQAATQQNITISCQSVYYTINSTTAVRRSLQQAINVQFQFTVRPITDIIITSIVPPGQQTLYTQYPGSLYFGVNYYSGPLLQYTVQNISLPNNTIMTLEQNYQLYTNSQFNFTFASATLYPSDVTTFFDQILIQPGVFLWVFQDKNYNTYKELIDIRSGSLHIQDMSAVQQQLTSSLINYQKVFPFIVAYATTGAPCIMNFYNYDKGMSYSYSFCTATTEQIQNFNIFGNQIYIYTTKSNIYTATLNVTQFNNYGSFQSIQWALLNNQIVDPTALTQIPQCYPQQLIPYQSNGIYAIQCKFSVIIMNLKTLVYYGTITPKTTTSFIPVIVQTYLLLVEPTNIEEYNIFSLTGIFKTKDYPTYSATPVSYTKVTSCTYYAAVYDANHNQVFIVQPGQSVFAVMSSTISVPANVFFMQCMPGTETSILTIISTAAQGAGGAVNIYKLYEAYPQMVMSFTVNNQSTNMGAQFKLQVSSSVSPQTLDSVTFNTIATNQTQLTLTQDEALVKSSLNNFLNVGYQKETNFFFDFKQQQMYKGIILNFYIQCQQQSECNTTILLNNVIDKQRTISRTHKFMDVAQGHNGKFAYGQSQSKVWRFLGYMNQLYDMVQFPMSDPHMYCMKLAVCELDLLSVSACGSSDISSDFATPIQNTWTMFVVSYISTEPFTMGSFTMQASFVNKMIILDKYLFVFDADESIAQFFQGVHVYQFNFDNFTLYPQWYQFLGTLTLGQITSSPNTIFTSFDVIRTAIPGRFRFIFSTIDGWMITQTYDLTVAQPFAQFTEYYQIYVFPMLNTKQQSNAPLQSITFFNLNASTQQTSGNILSQYNALFVFKNISAFEAQLKYNENKQTLTIQVITEYVQYGYYQSQPNAKVIGNYVVFSGILPEHLLQTVPVTTAKQVLFVYQRNNVSGTQIPSLQKTAGVATTIISSGYPFYNSLNMFPFNGQLYYNQTSTAINSSILLINPDTNNLDNFWLKPNVSFEFVNNSVHSANVDLYARNDFMTMFCGTYKISIQSAPGSHKKHPYWVIGVVLGSVAGVIIIAVAIWQYNKRKNNGQAAESENLMNN